jgi:hypothetical protein
MERVVGDSIAFSRLLMLLMSVFAGLALLLTLDSMAVQLLRYTPLAMKLACAWPWGPLDSIFCGSFCEKALIGDCRRRHRDSRGTVGDKAPSQSIVWNRTIRPIRIWCCRGRAAPGDIAGHLFADAPCRERWSYYCDPM